MSLEFASDDTDHNADLACEPAEIKESRFDQLRDAISEQIRTRKPRAPSDVMDAVIDGIRAVLGDLDSASQAAGVWEIVSPLLSYCLDSASPLKELRALAYASGLVELQGLSMRDIAALNGETRQAFSVRVGKVLRDLHLSPSANMRTDSERHLYRTCQLQRQAMINRNAPKRPHRAVAMA